jgi:hypothetical protein
MSEVIDNKVNRIRVLACAIDLRCPIERGP